MLDGLSQFLAGSHQLSMVLAERLGLLFSKMVTKLVLLTPGIGDGVARDLGLAARGALILTRLFLNEARVHVEWGICIGSLVHEMLFFLMG